MSKINKQLFDILTCYHEASHAIIAMLHDCKVINIELVKNGGGLTSMSKEPDSIIDGLKISYAGYLGELKICKSMFLKQSANLLKSGSSSDFEEIKDLLKKTKIKRKTIIKLTNVEINKYWSDICLVANLLMMNEKISFILLRKVLTEYSINKEFWSSKIKLAPRKKRDMITV